MLIVDLGKSKVECCTITDLAKMCGRKSSALRKLETRGLFPQANLRTADVELGDGSIRRGQRLYTRELSDAIATIFHEEVKQGIKITHQTQVKLKELFRKEREKYKL